ncbi:MAG TPA: hypothetical protein VIU86_19845 [Gaiellaceae bacterium]
MSHSCDETYDVYDERQRRAIKAHECEACGLPIRKGDQYTSVRVVFNGSAETIKRCVRCQTIHEHLREMAPGEMWPDEHLNCGTLYRDEWEREPPAWLEALAFWQPGDPLPALNRCTAPLPRYWGQTLACWEGWRDSLGARCCARFGNAVVYGDLRACS